VDFFTADFLLIDFLAAVFLRVDFFAAVFLRVDFFAAVFLRADFFAGDFLPVDFFAFLPRPLFRAAILFLLARGVTSRELRARRGMRQACS
jgi:hypothetical protein